MSAPLTPDEALPIIKQLVEKKITQYKSLYKEYRRLMRLVCKCHNLICLRCHNILVVKYKLIQLLER